MGKIKVNSSKDEIIENIRAAHIKNRLTMFVGASLSYISGSKKWIELIHDMQSEMGEPLNKDIGFDEMIKIPQIFDNFLKNDQDRFLAFVSSSLGIENIKPNLCHSLIMQLAPKKIITTNFDNLLEDAASDALMTYKTIAKDEDIDGIDGSPIILKVHGDIRSQNIVLTEVDFLNYEDNFKLISTILKASFATDLVLIIGYSIRDANIKRILNSTEKVLKSKLRKPYFIHVEDSEIEERDYEYYQSLGVEIIDYKVFCEKQNTYEDKFTTILNEIIKFCTNKNYSIYKTGDDPIDFLYSRLELLDNFCVLRLNDIVEALKPHVRNDSGSILSLRETDDDFFEVFNDFLIDSKKSKNENTSKKIKLIESVLKKSGFIGYYYNKIHLFNYKLDSMVGRAYNFIDFLEFDIMVGDDQIGLSEKLKKGYYLCKFQEYERAIELFESVASDAFKRREYVYYLIAQSNRKFAYKLGTIYFSKDFMNVEKNKLWSDYFSNRSTHLIESLPVQAQDKLKPMFDFGSAQINKLSSEVYLLAQQLLSDTVKNVVYFGESTFEKMSRKIIEIERFAKENYLIEDSFKEHHEIIRNSMINLMIRHASTKYERITEGYFDGLSLPKPSERFSDIHFHFMINYLKMDDFSSIQQISPFSELEFDDISHINEYLIKFISPFFDEGFISKYPRFLNQYGTKFPVLLTLLRFINIGEATLKTVLDKLFKIEYRFYDVSYVVLLLDKQKARFSSVSYDVQNTVAKKICKYLDDEISHWEAGMKFNMNTKYGYSYEFLVDYIDDSSLLSSNGFNEKIMKLYIASNQSCISRILHLASKSSDETRKRISETLVDSATKENVYEIVLSLCTFEYECTKLNNIFLEYLRDYVAIERDRKPLENLSPKDVRYYNLVRVSKYYLGGALRNISLDEFLGLSNQIDFMINPEQFNFDLFELEWIYLASSHELESLSKTKIARKSIRSKILNSLSGNNFESSDRLKLYEILNKYFS